MHVKTRPTDWDHSPCKLSLKLKPLGWFILILIHFSCWIQRQEWNYSVWISCESWKMLTCCHHLIYVWRRSKHLTNENIHNYHQNVPVCDKLVNAYSNRTWLMIYRTPLIISNTNHEYMNSRCLNSLDLKAYCFPSSGITIWTNSQLSISWRMSPVLSSWAYRSQGNINDQISTL